MWLFSGLGVCCFFFFVVLYVRDCFFVCVCVFYKGNHIWVLWHFLNSGRSRLIVFLTLEMMQSYCLFTGQDK